MNNYLLLIPILLPAAFGCLLPLIKPLYVSKLGRSIYVAVAAFLALGSVICTICQGESDLYLWSITNALPIYFHFDKLGMIFALLTSFMWVVNVIFAFEYMKHEGREIRYFSLFLISLTALLGVCYAGNLITAYMFYEMMSVFTMPMVLHSLSKESIEAAKKYLFYSMGGAFLGLLAFFIMNMFVANGAAGFVFIPGGCLDMALVPGRELIIFVGSICFIIGFGSKAGMWPLHGWLPTAHPVAPAPASAVLSGNITKMGVLMIIRYVYYVAGAKVLHGSFVQYAFMGLSLLTVLMGSMMAYKENILKKRLAYSTVSQVSYVLFGLSCMNVYGIVGALMHVVFHSLVKNTLFLNAGAVIYKTGCTKVSELRGIGKRMPITMWCFTLVSLTLVGIPPTSAFVSKWYLALGSLGTKVPVVAWLGPVILLTSALLTAGYLISISIMGFFPGEDFDCKADAKCEANALMLVPMIILTALAVILGIYPGGFTDVLMDIAASIAF